MCLSWDFVSGNWSKFGLGMGHPCHGGRAHIRLCLVIFPTPPVGLCGCSWSLDWDVRSKLWVHGIVLKKKSLYNLWDKSDINDMFVLLFSNPSNLDYINKKYLTIWTTLLIKIDLLRYNLKPSIKARKCFEFKFCHGPLN